MVLFIPYDGIHVMIVFVFFSCPFSVDIDEVLWPFRLCLCFRSWNVRIVSPDMRWQ